MLLGRGERKIRQFFSENARLSGIFGICPVEHSLSIHPDLHNATKLKKKITKNISLKYCSTRVLGYNHILNVLIRKMRDTLDKK